MVIKLLIVVLSFGLQFEQEIIQRETHDPSIWSSDGYGKSPISVGPWGGQGGLQWDDGVYSSVRQLIITHGTGIDSIQIEYDRKGSSVWSEKHGGSGGIKTDRVKLDFPDEFLTSIHGHYGSIQERGPTFVRSLTFESNRKTYGPFGTEQGAQFSFSMTGGKIVGFHGKSGWYLDSIGVYLKSLQKPNSSKALVTSQNLVTDHKVGYTVVQGNIGKDYDIVLAVRQRDDSISKLSNNFSTQTTIYREVNGGLDQSKEKLVERRSATITVGPVTYGPWGGNGGIIFDDGMYAGVRQINLSRNAAITSIKVFYDQNGQAIWGTKNGGSGVRIRSDKIIFDYPYEILTHITGYYGAVMFMGPTVIKSLTFHSTKGKYGPFGDEQGTFFSTNLKEGMVVGFHGRKGWFIDALGVHVLEGKLSLPQPPTSTISFSRTNVPISEFDNPQWSNKLVLTNKQVPREEVAYGVIKEPAPCGPGPWGGDGGKPWDDGVFSGIKQIFLTRGEAICSIQIEYDRNGQSVWSVRHGGSGGEATNRIKFEYPHEVLTRVSGFYGSTSTDQRLKVIRSITFYTSRGKYGPYGEEIGTFFTSTTTEGKVVGFHGRSSIYLDAIGVHMQHWLGERRSAKPTLFKIFS